MIVGPTGSGKTALAVKLVRRFGGVILSADSRQLYRGMDIGTAKPTRTEQRTAKHYFVDVIRPNQTYSAGRFQREVYALVRTLHHRKPDEPLFLVGGTYLYVDAVLKGWNFAATPKQAAIRRRLEKLSLAELQELIHRLDPATAKKIDIHNRRRLVRALEVILSTGSSFYKQRTGRVPDWNILKVGLRVPQTKLDISNRKRIDRMFRQDWVAEVKRLRKRYQPTAPGFYAHGYREVLGYIQGKTTLAQTKERIAINTRHHTKRQMAWFKKDKAIHWISPRDYSKAARLVSRVVAP